MKETIRTFIHTRQPHQLPLPPLLLTSHTSQTANNITTSTITAAKMSDFQVWTATEPYIEPHCKLGEGPFYEAQSNTLRFVDIIQRRLHTVDLALGAPSLTTLQLDAAATVTADIEGVDPREKILIGVKHGLAVLDRKSGAYEYVARLGDEGGERLRTNDGGADPRGRFWLGTMTDFGLGPFQPEGESLLPTSHKMAS